MATICLRRLGKGQRRTRLPSTITCKCVTVAATQFSMCKISTIPLWTHSLRCWITILCLPKSARVSLWCSPVVYTRTTLASVFIAGIPLVEEAVVFHTINLMYHFSLSCPGCEHLSFFFWGIILIFLISALFLTYWEWNIIGYLKHILWLFADLLPWLSLLFSFNSDVVEIFTSVEFAQKWIQHLMLQASLSLAKALDL